MATSYVQLVIEKYAGLSTAKVNEGR